MNLVDLKNILQGYCHEGLSMHEVEVCDKDGKHVCVVDSIYLDTSELENHVRLIVHPKDVNSFPDSN